MHSVLKSLQALEGLSAIEETTAHGESINVTLIFSLDRYAEAVEAYLRGLERLIGQGGDPSTVTYADLCILATLAQALARARAVPLAA